MKNNDFNIVFLGGSITEGTGAVAKDKAYVHIVGEYFKNLYKHKKLIYIMQVLGELVLDLGF